MKNAIAYVRSASRQAADQIKMGDNAQESAIRAYCRENGVNLLQTFYDIGVSGKDFEGDGWKNMERYLAGQQDHIQFLVVENYDRISRDYYSMKTKIAAIEKEYGVIVLVVSENSSGAYGVFANHLSDVAKGGKWMP